MRIQKFTLVFAILLLSCSSTYIKTGLEYLETDDNQNAYIYLLKAADNGNPYAIYVIGWMYENGRMEGGNDTITAIKYYHLAARYNEQNAINSLITLGVSVPYPDIYIEKQNQKQAIANSINEASKSIQKSIENSSSKNSSTSTNPYSNYSTTKSSYYKTANECWNDFDCEFGQKCIKAAGNIDMKGTCVTPVNEYGVKQYGVGTDIKPTEVVGCSFDIDCPIGFTCYKKNGELKGICIKK